MARGESLFSSHNCAQCHVFVGVEPTLPVDPRENFFRKGLRQWEGPWLLDDRVALQLSFAAKSQRSLAPDLRQTRARMRPDVLLAWLQSPQAFDPQTPMPPPGFSRQEAADVARYLLETPLPPEPPRPIPPLPPILERKVSFQEVNDKVFRASCRHCHADPDFALGDGGPGNTGGMGFHAHGLILADLRGVRSGVIGDDGVRHSIVSTAPTSNQPNGGESRLVLALMARHAEVAGQPVPDFRGMPVGLPPLPLEDIQLVRTWVAQGANFASDPEHLLQLRNDGRRRHFDRDD